MIIKTGELKLIKLYTGRALASGPWIITQTVQLRPACLLLILIIDIQLSNNIDVEYVLVASSLFEKSMIYI